MKKYIINRLLVAIPTFLGITILAFVLTSLAPGSPIDMLTGDIALSAEEVARMEAKLGIDQPIYIQYFTWLGQLLQGNLGYSYRTGAPVLGMIMERLAPTLILTGTSLAIAVLLAVAFGVIAALNPYTVWDYLTSGLSFLATSTPSFFSGLVFIYLFAVRLGCLPMGGMYFDNAPKTWGALGIHLIMPAMALAFLQMGSLIRFVRGSMLEVISEDYIRTARAKGLRERIIIVGHELRNSLIPVVTEIGLQIPFLVGGAVVAEQVFSWPGIGSLMVNSITARDYPVVMGITVVIAVAVLLGNLLVDLLYGVLDPRINHERKEG